MIEAWFDFPKLNKDNAEIPYLLNQMVATDDSGSLLFRVRLEGSLTFDYNPTGEVEEDIWTVSSTKKYLMTKIKIAYLEQLEVRYKLIISLPTEIL